MIVGLPEQAVTREAESVINAIGRILDLHDPSTTVR
jgi:hypothetical protein